MGLSSEEGIFYNFVSADEVLEMRPKPIAVFGLNKGSRQAQLCNPVGVV
jgi:hypothetical protein